MALSTFQEFVSFKDLFKQFSTHSTSEQEQQLLKWSALLPAQSEQDQADQVEKVFLSLTEAVMDDKKRLKLAHIAKVAMDRLIASLRRYYIHEIGALDDQQLLQVGRVKSLYQASVSLYNGIIKRMLVSIANQTSTSDNHQWRRHLNSSESTSTLQLAIYNAMLSYQKTMRLEALCYQKPSKNLWLAINQLYYLASQQHVAYTRLDAELATRQANNIHKLYCQICLHSLLNVRALSRANMVMIQRFIPKWARNLETTLEPRAKMPLFVDLHSDLPPVPLDPYSSINPYEEQYDCMFIALDQLEGYLQTYQESLADYDSETAERCLVDQITRSVNYRYTEAPFATLTNKASRKEATLITGFNAIHYQVSGSQGLLQLLDTKSLAEAQWPRYDTSPSKSATNPTIAVITIEEQKASSRYRRLQLLASADSADAKDDAATKPSQTESEQRDKLGVISPYFDIDSAEHFLSTVSAHDTAPPSLRHLRLFLLCRSDISNKPDWSLGIVRWLNTDSSANEVEWQVLGHDLTPCAVRLDDKGARSPHFVPALIIGADAELQTVSTLLLPRSHFHTKDKVILRINNEEQSLCLERNLINTEEFGQYEMMRL